MQKDVEVLAKEMQKMLYHSSQEYYFHRLNCCRDDYKWGGYSHMLDEKVLIADLRDSLVGPPPFIRDTLLVKQQLVEKGVKAFIVASDDDIVKFQKIIRKRFGLKMKTMFLRLFWDTQNLGHIHE